MLPYIEVLKTSCILSQQIHHGCCLTFESSLYIFHRNQQGKATVEVFPSSIFCSTVVNLFQCVEATIVDETANLHVPFRNWVILPASHSCIIGWIKTIANVWNQCDFVAFLLYPQSLTPGRNKNIPSTSRAESLEHLQHPTCRPLPRR